MAAKTVAHVIQDHFGESISIALADRLSGKPTPRIQELFNSYMAFANSGIQRKDDFHLRPCLYMPSEDNGMLIGPRPPGILSMQQFGTLLLYSHSVAFEDRLGHAIWRELMRSNAPFLVSVSSVIGYYATYHGDLVSENIVVPLAFNLEDRFNPRSVPNDQFEHPVDVYKLADLDLDQASDVQDCLRFARRFSLSSDIWLPTLDHIDLLRKYCRETSSRIRASERDLQVLATLGTLDIPAVADLSASDLRAIRRSSEVFGHWRDALRTALCRMMEVSEGGIGQPDKEFRQVMREHRERVLEASRSRRLRHLFSRTTKTFSVGAIGASAATILFGAADLGTTMVAGGASAGAELLADIAAGRTERRAQRAHDSHYAVVLKPDADGSLRRSRFWPWR